MSPPPASPPQAPAPLQDLQGFLGNDEWDALLAHLDHLVGDMERITDVPTRKRVFEMLQAIDTLHREALHRLVRLFREGVLEKVITDPAIHTLMELYDLLPSQADAECSAAPAPPKRHRFPDIPVRVEYTTPSPSHAPRPHWLPALETADAPTAGASVLRRLDGHDVLLCRVDQQWFALEAHCALDGASLEGARLNRYTLICPHHAGCLYDVRQGRRMGDGEHHLACLPVQVDDQGRVQVGFGMPFTPHLPSY